MTNHSININDGHLVDRSVDAFYNKSNILFISGANYQSNGGWSLGAFYANYHCHKCICLNYGLWTYSVLWWRKQVFEHLRLAYKCLKEETRNRKRLLVHLWQPHLITVHSGVKLQNPCFSELNTSDCTGPLWRQQVT